MQPSGLCLAHEGALTQGSRAREPSRVPGQAGSQPPGPRGRWLWFRFPGGLESHAHPHPQLWEISSGDLLLSVLFDVGIMAVTMDLAEYHVFCGGSDGSIFQVDLCTWVSTAGAGGGEPGARGARGSRGARGGPGLAWLRGPLGLHSLGRKRRASSRSRTAGRCSEGTGAGAVDTGWGQKGPHFLALGSRSPCLSPGTR